MLQGVNSTTILFNCWNLRVQIQKSRWVQEVGLWFTTNDRNVKVLSEPTCSGISDSGSVSMLQHELNVSSPFSSRSILLPVHRPEWKENAAKTRQESHLTSLLLVFIHTGYQRHLLTPMVFPPSLAAGLWVHLDSLPSRVGVFCSDS